MTLQTCQFLSPMGPISLTASEKGLREVRFGAPIVEAKHLSQLLDHPILRQTAEQLNEYFMGQRQIFTLPLEPVGTEFQKEIWRALQNIPFGQIISYQQLAHNVLRPSAYRAAGNANGKNPLPIIVPCHRVIASNGQLGGFSAGLDKKVWLLQHEGVTQFA